MLLQWTANKRTTICMNSKAFVYNWCRYVKTGNTQLFIYTQKLCVCMCASKVSICQFHLQSIVQPAVVNLGLQLSASVQQDIILIYLIPKYVSQPYTQVCTPIGCLLPTNCFDNSDRSFPTLLYNAHTTFSSFQ